MTTILRLIAVLLSALAKTSLSFSTGATNSLAPKGFTGVRISLYPKVNDSQSLKQTIKDAVSGISDLGLEVRADDVSSALLGPEPALFEAVRAVFGRACRAEGEPHVSMIATFSAGCPGEDDDDSPMPERTVHAGDDWIDDAMILPSRVACQYAVYPLGTVDYMSTIYSVIDHAKASPSYKDGKSHFCTMLDGDGAEVFDVLRSSFELARAKHSESGGGSHVTMTATLTANKSAWKK
mmetsp:Transcript_34799/g.70396  ORF Transcript_34799/g.70396 Transcript_34799/m.70396 type:complete len:237 (+) Transcript_34799:114-824(+)